MIRITLTFLLLLGLAWSKRDKKDKGSQVMIPVQPQMRKTKKVGMFTPYNIVPGGGERYFLTSAVGFQQMGYDVDILVKSDNTCQSLESLKRTTAQLRVNLNYDHVQLLTITQENNRLIDLPLDTEYEVFYIIGNDKMPQIKGYGTKLNYYMCQFPFDMYDPTPSPDVMHEKLESLATFDIVLVNSVFTLTWYGRAVFPYYDRLIKSGKKVPSVNILYPPVDPFPLNVIQSEAREKRMDVVNIALLGRFFVGRQSKGQNIALDILSDIVKRTPKRFVLNLIGAVSPEKEHHDYVEELKRNATERKLNVNFLTNASPEDISKALSRSTIQWHLTGIHEDKHGGDPASLEHFGIAVVEGMSSGCIPIVLNRGGTIDIVQNRVNGFVADGPADFVRRTLQLSKTSPELLNKMRESAMNQSRVFYVDRFYSRLSVMTHRGVISKDFRDFASNYIQLVRSLTPKSVAASSKYAAVIVEPIINSDFEFCVRNVISHLGKDWSLQVHFSKASKSFVRNVLKDIENIQFKPLPHYVRDTLEYNKLLRSRDFWESTNAEKVLIFQSDSVMLRSGIQEFVRFDYVGAPWDVSNNERVASMISEGTLKTSVGNGGFSLRSVSAMIHIIEEFGDRIPMDFQEDMFFSRFAADLGYSVAPPEVAYRFCREVPLRQYSSQYATDHLGLHAAWYYMRDEETVRFLENSLRVHTVEY